MKQHFTRPELAGALRGLGFPISDSKLAKLCAPSVNQGPAISGYWGRRPLYTLDAGIAWAESLVRAERRALQQPVEAIEKAGV